MERQVQSSSNASRGKGTARNNWRVPRAYLMCESSIVAVHRGVNLFGCVSVSASQVRLAWLISPVLAVDRRETVANTRAIGSQVTVWSPGRRAVRV